MENTENKTEINQNQPQDSGKETAKYEANINKLAAILGGKDKLFKVKKATKDEMSLLVAELMKEQKDELVATIKTELKVLLDKKVTLDKEIKAEEEKLAKLKQQKQKEFNDACSKVFGKVDGLEALEKNYLETLKSTTEDKK